MLKKLIEKLRAKFPAITPGCFMLKIARLDDAFLEVFSPEASPVEGQKKKKKRREKEKKERRKKNSKTILISAHARVTTRSWWQEKQAVVLQTHFRPDHR